MKKELKICLFLFGFEAPIMLQNLSPTNPIHVKIVQIDVLASLLSGRLVRERIGPAMLSAVQSQVTIQCK
jgi:hypothetical protein